MTMATPPQKLSPVHHQVCALSASGLKRYEIAAVTGYSEAQVTNILAHPDAETLVARLTTDLMQRMTDDVGTMIQGAAKEAFLKNLHLMRNAENEAVQQRSVFDILDRAGFKPREVHVNANMTLPAKEAELIRETLEHMGRDVTPRPPVDNAVEILSKRIEERTALDATNDNNESEEAA